MVMLDAVSESDTMEKARIREAVSAVSGRCQKSFFYQTGPSPEEAGGPAIHCSGVVGGCSYRIRGLRASAKDIRSGLVKSHGELLQPGRADSRAWLHPFVASLPAWSLPACPAWDWRRVRGRGDAGRDSSR